MKTRHFWLLLPAVLILLGGCTARRPAPVTERQPEISRPSAPPVATPAPASKTPLPERDALPEFYTVKKGDTLYSIALEHGLDYKELAEWNGLKPDHVIRVDQQLRLRPPPTTVVTAPLVTAPPVSGKPVPGERPRVAGDAFKTQPKATRLPYSDQALAQLSGKPPAPAKPDPRPDEKPAAVPESSDQIAWGWPAAGRIIGVFSEGTGAKGLEIAGKLGQPVYAAAPGRVIFSGDGPRGYGKLIVVKHNEAFISVYAHNSDLVASYGQTVKKGQKIAEMGSSDADRVKLHFEIRRYGKPVDPAKFLPGDQPS